ncbi:MAG: protein phosphatase 2C domain-containing protein [Chloroflexi bacterium]|nr:protein phosphatase 2C domain-containing protein [Chloroflexota bacterium]
MEFLKNFFDKKRKTKEGLKASETIQTTPLTEDQLNSVSRLTLAHKPAQFLIGSGQSVGMQREHNEDTLFSMSSVVADGVNDISFGMGIIADGMGGHKNGEIASGVATRVAAKRFITKVYSRLLSIHPEPLDESIQEAMQEAINETQKAVVRYAPGGGTTFTCALIIGEQVTIGHVGDSRAYFIYPDGRIQRVTKDHSLVQRMIDLEEINENQAQDHPQRNVLLKAIGQGESVHPDIQTFQIPKGGFLMMCSDGLWGVLRDAEIYKIISSSHDPVLACQKLVEEANKKGGPDNISVILIDFYGQ